MDTVHTKKHTKSLLPAETLCPRWDSNRVPALANTGLPRKHAEYGPVRHLYGPVRDPKCGHCPHPRFSPPEASPRLPHPASTGCGKSLLDRIDAAVRLPQRQQPGQALAHCGRLGGARRTMGRQAFHHRPDPGRDAPARGGTLPFRPRHRVVATVGTGWHFPVTDDQESNYTGALASIGSCP